jgi:hypothetical protein
MRLAILMLLLAFAGTLVPAAPAAVTVRTPVDDVGLPYWCDWGYDWDERCYRDAGPRLPVGGVDDKVWRAALRFSLAGMPAGASVDSARLELYFDGVCVAPRRSAMPCPAGYYTLDAHRIASADWYHEREPEYNGDIEDETWVAGTDTPRWLAWDLTGLVRSWVTGEWANNGVLIKLVDGDEDFATSGPYMPSMSSTSVALRPRLVIAYASPTGRAP